MTFLGSPMDVDISRVDCTWISRKMISGTDNVWCTIRLPVIFLPNPTYSAARFATTDIIDGYFYQLMTTVYVSSVISIR